MISWVLPPWVTAPAKVVKAVIKAVPWQVWLVLALIAAVWWHGTAMEQRGYDRANGEWQARFDLANAKADREAREAERAHTEEIDRIAVNLIEERNRGFQERDKIIADLRAGTVRMRSRFKCPAVRPAAPGAATAGSDGGTPAGLSDADAEFLIRESARSDEIVRQLTACQAVIRADRAMINGDR